MKPFNKVEKLSTFFETLSTSPATQAQSNPKSPASTSSFLSSSGSRNGSTSSAEIDKNLFVKDEDALAVGPHLEVDKESPIIPKPAAMEKGFLLKSSTPPIPPRNPARSLRGKFPEKALIEASSTWQQQHDATDTVITMATRPQSPKATSFQCAHSAQSISSDTTDNVHNKTLRDDFKITDDININTKGGNGGAVHEGHCSVEDSHLGLGINIETLFNLSHNNSSTVESIPNHTTTEHGLYINGSPDALGTEFEEDSDSNSDDDHDSSTDGEGGFSITVYGHEEVFEEHNLRDDTEVKVDKLAELLKRAHKDNGNHCQLCVEVDAKPGRVALSVALSVAPSVAASPALVVAEPVASVTETSSPYLSINSPSVIVTGEGSEPVGPTHELIDSLLEQNYRGQAETFARKSSRTSVRSRSNHSERPISTRSVSGSSQGGTFYTPTRQPGKSEDPILQTRGPQTRTLQTPSEAIGTVVEPFPVRSRSGFSPGTPDPSLSPQVTYGHRLYTVPKDNQQLSVLKRGSRPLHIPEIPSRGFYYFTEEERRAITELVQASPRKCEKHPNCIECDNTEYAYFENKAMPTTMPPEERNKIIGNNRSLRAIKNELESLAENGAISDEQFDAIMSALPTEAPLGGGGRSPRVASPVPAPVPAEALNNLRLNDTAAPPAYSNPTPPSLPARETPSRPELARATALYRYTEAGDCNFEVGDQIAVYEYMNADWWLGKNIRTNHEGVFPVNYVQVQANPTLPSRAGSTNPPPQGGYYGNEKTGAGYGGGYPAQKQQHQPPPPPGPSNPYNSSVPPVALAEQPVDGKGDGKNGKGKEMGTKFGKKLGNAAIFGAGATIGGNIVNSIF